ncbi:MAG: Gfo/Idh/MocA family protein [Candidatus Helarchaeota archaeon]
MINLGIIGFGDMGRGHCSGFKRLSGCKIVGVADPDKKQLESAKGFLKKSSPILCSNYRELLEIPEIDAIIVATPNYLHAPITIEALKAGKHVFLEKPVTVDVEQMDEIIKTMKEVNRIVQIGLVYRYSNLYRTMVCLVEQGTFGNIMMAYCKEYRDNFPTPWFFDEKKSGGAILEKNCHHFDLFNWFIHSPPKKVFAMGGQHTYKPGHVIQCMYSPLKGQKLATIPTIVDHANVLIEYENGAKGNLGLCMYEIAPNEGLEIGIIGDNGAWSLARNDRSLTIAGGPVGELREVEVDYYSDNKNLGHIGCQVERMDFLECIKQQKQPYANLLIARDACLIGIAAEKSIKEERIVSLSEFSNPEIDEIFNDLGLERYPPTPSIISLDKKRLKARKKRELKNKERALQRELLAIRQELDRL